MDKVAKGPDYNIHEKKNKQTKNHEICESRITGQTTNYNNIKLTAKKKDWNRNLKPKNEMAIIYYTCNNEW